MASSAKANPALPQSLAAARASETPPQGQRPATNASRRRDKPQISCNLCRKRKLRCDRKQPCSSCASRDISCSYVQGSSGVVGPTLHDRLVQLENLIKLQMSPSTQETSVGIALPHDKRRIALQDNMPNIHRPIDTTDVPSVGGNLYAGGSELRYLGGDHWAAILDSITEFKDQLNQEETNTGISESDNMDIAEIFQRSTSIPIPPKRRALLLYGCPRAASHQEILNALPPKKTIDRYLSRYFTSLELTSCTIHDSTFLQEYAAFWANPSRVSIIWIGLLFGIMCLAITTTDVAEARPGDERDQAMRQVDVYVEKIVQCLALGQYTKAGPYVVESLVHYMHIEFAICVDANEDIWFLLSLIIKIAMSMGYHRDPAYFPKLTTLQGEMRRRLWATLIQADILISSQMGMPRIVSDSQWDTAEPSNLNDSDLDSTMSRLPASRPETEHTTSLGIISRIRILKVIGKIADLTSAVVPCTYSEITHFDGLLRDAQAMIPQIMQPKPLSDSITDSPQIIMARLFISQLFYKGQIMLHQRFLYLQEPLQEHEDQASYTYSYQVCLDAALGLLEIQSIMDQETCSAGQLHMMRWRVSSLINHQFLTATLILCSLLYRKITLGKTNQITAALETSKSIWMRSSSNSHEARKAAITISIVLAKAQGADSGGEQFSCADLNSDYIATTLNENENIDNLHWNNLDGEMNFDTSQMLEDLVRPNAGIPFQPDIFEGYTPPMMQDQVLSMFPDTQGTPPSSNRLGLEEWMLTIEPELD